MQPNACNEEGAGRMRMPGPGTWQCRHSATRMERSVVMALTRSDDIARGAAGLATRAMMRELEECVCRAQGRRNVDSPQQGWRDQWIWLLLGLLTLHGGSAPPNPCHYEGA